jgi:putative oxidoreductase
MNSFQRYVLVISRVLIAIIFLLNGLGIISQAMAAKALIEHGAPASVVPLLMLCARTIEVVGGLSLAFGIYPRLAAVALVAFLVPSTVIGHAFWQVDGTASYTVQLINFLKNTAMVGGLLFVAATPSQPILLPRTLRSHGREQTGSERASRSPTPAV